ncbi:zinc ribbon domain-containing protein, partial [uncultured Bilophila sp.]
INGEIDDDSTRIKKSKSKMMQVSNSREYQAMAREMDNMEKVNRSREEERAALMEEKMHQDRALQEVDAVWADLKAELETKQVSLETRLDEARKRLEELAQVRSETGSAVPRPVLDRYEFIRRRLSHPVIVPVTAGVCSGCRIMIPPQTFIELQGGHKIINCPNCQRLIYWVEHFNEETNQTADDMDRAAE